MCLWKTSVKKAERVRGRFFQSYYGYGGTNWGDYHARRWDRSDSTLKDIAGEVRVDVGKVDLEVSDLEGKVQIRNRFGTTRYHQNNHAPGSTYRIESDSGDVLVFLRENLIGEFDLTVNTMCGEISFESLKSLGKFRESNNAQFMTFSTILRTASEGSPTAEPPDADLYIKTRTGKVTIEKTT